MQADSVVRYEDFKTGLTYQDVYAMLWVDSEDSSTWARKSRGAVLRLWGKLKADMWAAYTGGLTPDEEYVPIELDADGVPLPGDDDCIESDVETLPVEAYSTPALRIVTVAFWDISGHYAPVAIVAIKRGINARQVTEARAPPS